MAPLLCYSLPGFAPVAVEAARGPTLGIGARVGGPEFCAGNVSVLPSRLTLMALVLCVPSRVSRACQGAACYGDMFLTVKTDCYLTGMFFTANLIPA
jgi:hypothetical protein